MRAAASGWGWTVANELERAREAILQYFVRSEDMPLDVLIVGLGTSVQSLQDEVARLKARIRDLELGVEAAERVVEAVREDHELAREAGLIPHPCKVCAALAALDEARGGEHA